MDLNLKNELVIKTERYPSHKLNGTQAKKKRLH